MLVGGLQSNWVPRRANNNPKTIEQIHKEAQEEEQKKQAEMQKATMERSRRGGPSGPVGGKILFFLGTCLTEITAVAI
jgi:hypothetical protein